MASASLASLLDTIRQTDLLSPAQLAETERRLPLYTEPRDLARMLVQQGWLTPFQVNQLLLGRSAELLLGPYLLVERLGEGAVGQIFKARHRPTGQLVALKVIRKERVTNPKVVQRFQREIRAAAQLAHPNIVAALDAGQAGDTHYYAMEYVEGSDLRRHVKESGPLPAAVACDYVRQAALGVQHAHERGLVHRDIKPSNLMLAAGGLVKVLDLGLARLRPTGEGDLAGTLTEEGAVIGTPYYLAPEQAVNPRGADIRADLYSLGCTFYFLLTGQAPFEGSALTEILIKHQLEEPKPLEALRPDVPAAVAAVVRKLMAKRPEDRYQTPAELVRALTGRSEVPAPAHAAPVAPRAAQVDTGPDWAAMTAEAAPEPDTPPVRGRAPGRRWLLGIGVGMGVLVAAVAVLVAVLGRGSTRVADSRPDTRRDMPPEKTGPASVMEKRITNSINMELVLIPAGRFLMGSPESEPGRQPDEGPQHEVLITRSFYLGTCEVTQQQYEAVMASNPSVFKGKKAVFANHPVENVSWAEAVGFCEKLSALEAEKKAGRLYRLPTEAEWEYACRAGSTTAYHFPEEATLLEKYAWFDGSPVKVRRTQPVAKSTPNAWGLFDMTGNVFEWCADYYDPDYYKASPRENPLGPAQGGARVVRGGSFNVFGDYCRSARRHRFSGSTMDLGFRVVCVPAAPERLP
jgi:formylglycine-generating enzyme required for sulfatase activity/tRNA A-37 threonylcarbamoyl transferase component Bud32